MFHLPFQFSLVSKDAFFWSPPDVHIPGERTKTSRCSEVTLNPQQTGERVKLSYKPKIRSKADVLT